MSRLSEAVTGHRCQLLQNQQSTARFLSDDPSVLVVCQITIDELRRQILFYLSTSMSIAQLNSIATATEVVCDNLPLSVAFSRLLNLVDIVASLFFASFLLFDRLELMAMNEA